MAGSIELSQVGIAWADCNPIINFFTREPTQFDINEPAEFEKEPVEVREFKGTTDHFEGIRRIDFKWMKAKPTDVNMM